MLRVYRFPLKGGYYYDAQTAYAAGLLKIGSPLEIVAEPDNAHDANALQIWLKQDGSPDAPPTLLGYVPRQLARVWRPVFADSPHYQAHLTHVALQGKWLHLQCGSTLQLNWRQRLLTRLWLFWLRLAPATQSFHRPT
ncbi:HIRAN domain-containing protein [Thiomicrorhabdus cannonii]|uniref:HIRAN domain-containing protein n=1 Tax=Thiomicrorhabdus cannonii TaxID=2748011 RepID=UPI0015BB1A60|nr:HIRAN domain-containing protein [Thiomicrorhabdus cannonii]